MFDKLIESEPEGADFHDRRRYFMVSSVVVGALFLTAVVISIYASDYGLGSNSFELSMMLAPVEMAAVEPEPAKPQPSAATSREQNQTPTRPEIMSRTDESTYVPISTSSAANLYRTHPEGFVRLGDDNDHGNSKGNGRETGGSGPGSGIASATQVDEGPSVTDPPPIKKETPKREVIRSLGPVNGRATYLPKPVYSPAAIALHIEGKVDVQVTIDETGRVTSAHAVSGNIVLRASAEQAAWNAKFTPTRLNNEPVKVTGVIIYNFIR